MIVVDAPTTALHGGLLIDEPHSKVFDDIDVFHKQDPPMSVSQNHLYQKERWGSIHSAKSLVTKLLATCLFGGNPSNCHLKYPEIVD